MRHLMAGSAIVFGVCASGWASADELGDARAGEDLATRMCSQCHAVPSRIVEGQGKSLPGRSFAEIARSEKAAPDNLWSFLRTAHNSVSHPGNMPSQDLTDPQIRLIAAYMRELRTTK